MLKVILIILGVLFVLLLLFFCIYFFNLDMKFMVYVVAPFLEKHFDKQKPDTYL